jgi:hypothetical protein
MRLLGESLALKEQVPLEAVLAYVELKHTLYLEGDDAEKTSLAKACKQVRGVHELPEREKVTALQIHPALSLDPRGFAPVPRPGYFDHRNPLYCALFARNLVVSKTEKREPTMDEIGAAIDRELKIGRIPDAIAAGEALVVPAFKVGDKTEIRPVLRPPGVFPHGSLIKDGSIGLGILHLLWVIEQLELGRIPWSDVLADAENRMKRR